MGRGEWKGEVRGRKGRGQAPKYFGLEPPLGFRVSVRTRVSCRCGLLDTASKDIVDFLCSNADSGR